uniref:protein DA1 n=1 Tax=Acinetobacter piscicola TaxID=2006115 RepID=UPI001BC8761F
KIIISKQYPYIRFILFGFRGSMMFGNLYQRSSCYYCHNTQFTNKMSRYNDGRLLCIDCVQHIIVTTENLQKVAVWVLQQIENLGFKFKRGNTQVSLISQDKMQTLGFNGAEGLAINTTKTNIFSSTWHDQAQIKVIYGMPTANLVWVLGHELAHVLVSQHQYKFATQEKEEGFCQLVALLISERSANPLMSRIIQKELKNRDPIYGEELREAYQQYQKVGFQRYFQTFL